MSDLPIEAILPSLAKALAGHADVVLAAESGAGKTARVPLALMNEPWLEGRKTGMLASRPRATIARWRPVMASYPGGRRSLEIWCVRSVAIWPKPEAESWLSCQAKRKSAAPKKR